MTDEQTPSGTPPEDPLNPTPQQPPPPPVNPYEQQPAEQPTQQPEPTAPQPSHGDPQASPPPPAPPYGDPGQQSPPPPPAYGAPQGAPAYPAYPQQPGQPGYGQPSYGQQGAPYVPGQPMPGQFSTGEQEPGKGMAITALVLSLVCCFPVGLVLGIIVLLRSRDGRNHGKGLAIASIVISTLVGLGAVAGGIAASQFDWDSLRPVENLETGECLDASNLTDDDEDFVEDVEEVSCSEPHDAEVLVTTELTAEEADAYDPGSSTLCTDLITEGGLLEKLGPDLSYFGLTTSDEPSAGDKLVCLAYDPSGAKLEGPL